MSSKTKDQATTTAADPIVRVQILTNGIEIHGAHHAAGKTMSLAKSQADVLTSLNPPAVRIVGI